MYSVSRGIYCGSRGRSKNSKAFEPGDLSSLPLGHYGLVGMQERVERVGGKLVLSSHSGSGTEVKFQVPRRATAPSDEDEKEIHVGL